MVDVLLLGATGTLGQEFARQLKHAGKTIESVARKNAMTNLDIKDGERLLALLDKKKPQLTINCCAMVDVAGCEVDPDLALAINATPAGHIAKWAAEYQRDFIQISTDHYYVGKGRFRSREVDAVTLVNAYATSKFSGERLALQYEKSLVIRTSILGERGWGNATFFEWAMQSVLSNASVTLFDDAYTSSIDIHNLVHIVLRLYEQGAQGIFNIGASQVFSKKEFVLALADKLSKSFDKYETGSVLSLLPLRPDSLGLDTSKAEFVIDRQFPSLSEVIESLLSKRVTERLK